MPPPRAVQRPHFVNPTPAPGETDITRLSDARFLARWPGHLGLFQKVLTEASLRSTMGTGSLCSPSIHVATLTETNEGEDADVSSASLGTEVRACAADVCARSR